MKKTTIILTALSTIAVGGLAHAQTIGAVEAGASGTVTLTSDPVITAIMSAPGTLDGYTYANYAVLATDGTGGAELFGKIPTATPYTPTVGDEVAVAGTYSPYNQIPEIESMTSITAVSSGNTVPSPVLSTIPVLNQTALPLSVAGYLVELNNVTISTNGLSVAGMNFPTHGNGTYTITDGSGNSMTLYQWASSYSAAGAFGGTAIPTGEVDIEGLMDVYSTANPTSPEFIPYSITPVAAPEPSSVALATLGGGAILAFLRRRK